MRLYYRAVAQNGKRIQGFIESKDVREAARYLRQHQLIPVKITAADHIGLAQFFHLLRKTSVKELIFFTRQLASMLTSGLTLMQALIILKDQMKSSGMTETVESVVADIQ